MPLIPAQLRSAIRFQLDGLRLHPRRRLVIAAMIAGLIGLVSISIFAIQALRAGPTPAPPPKPLSVLPELPEAADRTADLKALTNLALPAGWKLVAATSNAKADGPGSKSWLFMLPKSADAAAKIDEIRKLALKPAAPAPAAELAEALALSLNRLAIGKPIAAFSTPQWEAPGNTAARLDLLELDQVLIARISWFAKR